MRSDLELIEKPARDAILLDGTRVHKATLVRYFNEHPHLFGEESRKLDVNRLLMVIQGAKNSTNTTGPAQDGSLTLAVGIGDFVEFLQGTHRRVGLIIEIFNARHESQDEEDAAHIGLVIIILWIWRALHRQHWNLQSTCARN